MAHVQAGGNEDIGAKWIGRTGGGQKGEAQVLQVRPAAIVGAAHTHHKQRKDHEGGEHLCGEGLGGGREEL